MVSELSTIEPHFICRDNSSTDASLTRLDVITENLKGLKEGGNILIEPILEIDTNEVEASHFVTIGTYDEESLLYLNSLGIKENDAKKLLKKSFMLSIFDDNFKKEVNYE